ncbi:hypothetical protein [Williamsia sp. DF01-3]|uniref:hypothetical protein n=1 Tax=Williamsia sp. DF01-3 TaxID=2934157 RepID=UPI001FF4FA14|nr:hypothetical protein [Williamsia sp. DF01-3]MCK0518943.1 hypothetical protein [Williamsia sp. DF01-3]
MAFSVVFANSKVVTYDGDDSYKVTDSGVLRIYVEGRLTETYSPIGWLRIGDQDAPKPGGNVW